MQLPAAPQKTKSFNKRSTTYENVIFIWTYLIYKFIRNPGQDDIIRMLFTRKDTNANVQDKDGLTPLHFAASFGNCLHSYQKKKKLSENNQLGPIP